MKLISKLFIYISIICLLCACSSHKHEEEPATHEDSHVISSEIKETIASLSPEQMNAVGISIGKIEMRNMASTLNVNGVLIVPNRHKANITSLYGGVIKSLNVEIGFPVKKGQVVALISNPQFVQLQEDFLSTQAKLTFAEQELQRQTELNEGNAGAKKNLQSITAEVNALQIKKASLQQQLQLMGINSNTVSASNLKSIIAVISPLSGTISNVLSKIGSYVDVSTPIAEIIDNSAVHVDLHVFEKDISKFKIGQVINFNVTNNPTTNYEAVVINVGSSFENETKSLDVHCEVRGNKVGLIDGMNINGVISLSNQQTQAVPNDAIVNFEGKDYIFVVTTKKPQLKHDNHADEHGHSHEEKSEKDTKNNINFEQIEIIKGASNLGYTAITPIVELPKDTKIAIKGAFFINAKLNTNEDHDH